MTPPKPWTSRMHANSVSNVFFWFFNDSNDTEQRDLINLLHLISDFAPYDIFPNFNKGEKIAQNEIAQYEKESAW